MEREEELMAMIKHLLDKIKTLSNKHIDYYNQYIVMSRCESITIASEQLHKYSNQLSELIPNEND